MGFTPMEGLVMATRSGSIDPGMILWIQARGDLSAAAMEHVLEKESGLLGLSGRSGDLREVIVWADRGDEDAQLAYDVYVYRLRTHVAAMAAAMGGIDGLVFTGGAGEASHRLRTDTCAGLTLLDVTVDEVANRASADDGIISPAGTSPAVVVVHAREDLEIVRHVRELLGSV